MTVATRPRATVRVDGRDVDAPDARVTLDALAIPYATGSVTLPLADSLRTAQRVTLTGRDDGTGEERDFDLVVTGRNVSERHPATIALDLASDEWLLENHRQLADDDGAWGRTSSLRSICAWVLSKIGATLAPGTVDADMTPYWDAENAVYNARPLATADRWLGDGDGRGGNAVIEFVIDNPPADEVTGTTIGVLQVMPTDADPLSSYMQARTDTVRAQVGRAITGQGWIRPSTARTVRAGFDWIDRDGDRISTTFGATIDAGAGEWVQPVVTGTPPAGTVTAKFFLRAMGAHTRPEWLRVCRSTIVEGRHPVRFFDGTTADDEHYTYDWTNDEPTEIHKSPSYRTALNPRDPDAFYWEAGVTAWDFLQPLTASAGLRLYCDEGRVWRLIDPAEHTVAGSVDISAARSVDRNDRYDVAAAIDGVLVRYTWRDRDGVDHVRDDRAGTGGRVAVFEFETPWPGNGAAALVLRNRQGRGISQTTVAVTDWDATPGMAATGAGSTAGRVRSVSWDLRDGLMTITRERPTDGS